jgi:hypothetical protein
MYYIFRLNNNTFVLEAGELDRELPVKLTKEQAEAALKQLREDHPSDVYEAFAVLS